VRGDRVRRRVRFVASLAASAVAFELAAATAQATNALEFPDNGSEQMARGGAWVARASDPLATFYQPAGLAGQPTRVVAQTNLALDHACFTRVKAANDTTDDGVAPGGTYARVCSSSSPFPDGQIAFAWRLSDRLGVGAALLGPSGVPRVHWPDFTDAAGTPAPQRYLLLSSDAIILTPSLGAGAEVAPWLRLGASFQWGLAHLESAAAAPGLTQPGMSPATNDVKATIEATDPFFPGFTAGALASPRDDLDVAGWIKWSAPIVAHGGVRTEANYFTARVASGDTSKVARGDSSLPDCGEPGSTACAGGPVARVKIPVPFEAKLGVRWHPRRRRDDADAHLRDPIAQDRFDLEIDLTYANDAALDRIEIGFPAQADGRGAVPVVGTAGTIPPNADVPHRFRDVVGVRAGGDLDLLPGVLALRAGGFFETNGQEASAQNVDFYAASRVGVAGGATLRVPVGHRTTRAIEVSFGFLHVFVAEQSTTSPTAAGLTTIAGTPPKELMR